jgi:hypothetical protein
MGKQNDWKGFYNYDLTAEEKKLVKTEYKGWLKQQKGMQGMLEDIVCRGHKVSITILPDGSAYIVSATGTALSQNEGITTSQRHRFLDVALCALFYVVAIQFEWGEWPSFQAPLIGDDW